MHRKQFVRIAALFLSLAFFGINFISCQTNSSAKQQSEEFVLKPDEFQQKLSLTKDAQLIDVRTPEEYGGGHIQGARNIDWNGETFETEIATLDKAKPVFVYCLSGGRSASAAGRMRELNFNPVYELQGGMMAWNNAGKPVVNPGAKNPGMSMAEYDKLISSGKLVLVDFNAPWCGPCKKMAPMLEELAKEQENKMMLIKINVDENKELVKILKLQGLPVFFLYKNRKIIWESTGLQEKRSLEKIIIENSDRK